MIIWIDADGCPRDIRKIVSKATVRRRIRAVFVAVADLSFLRSEFVSTVTVSGQECSSDSYILKNAKSGDLVITADIPLSADLVKENIVVIHPQGDCYTAQSIGERLSLRNFLHSLRSQGVYTKDSSHYKGRGKQRFADIFDRELTKAQRKNDCECQ